MDPRQTLIEYARAPWGRPHPGVIVDATGERIIEVVPSWPIPGPNSVSRLRCTPARIEVIIDEARERFASRNLPSMWILDPDSSPDDLRGRLAQRGIGPDPHSARVSVMVLGAEATIAPTRVRVEFRDALASAQDFARAEAVQRAAFGSGPGEGRQAERLAAARADPGHTLLLAFVEGEAAGAAGGRLDRDGFMLRGGAVLPRFRGRGYIVRWSGSGFGWRPKPERRGCACGETASRRRSWPGSGSRPSAAWRCIAMKERLRASDPHLLGHCPEPPEYSGQQSARSRGGTA